MAFQEKWFSLYHIFDSEFVRFGVLLLSNMLFNLELHKFLAVSFNLTCSSTIKLLVSVEQCTLTVFGLKELCSAVLRRSVYGKPIIHLILILKYSSVLAFAQLKL